MSNQIFGSEMDYIAEFIMLTWATTALKYQLFETSKIMYSQVEKLR